MEHFIVDFGTPLWISGWLLLAGLALFAFGLLPKYSADKQRLFERIWAYSLLSALAIEHVIMIMDGTWSVKWSLPLQMCSMSGLLAIYTLLTHNRRTYLFLLFWGISGGFHSMLTPEMTLGADPFFSFTYYFWHASIIIIPLYFFKVKGFGLKRTSFFSVWGWTHLVWLVVGLVDYGIGANYMYILHPPQVDNPFIFGDFPYHLIGFDIAGFLHFSILSLVLGTISQRYGIGYTSDVLIKP